MQYHVIPPGTPVPDAPPGPQARAMLGLPPDVPVFSYVGRLVGIKRPDRLLQTAELVGARSPGVIFLVAGDGPLGLAFAEQVRARRAPVQLLGWRTDVGTVLAASDATVLTSDNEGTPLSLIQAGMLGIPAVATDVGSVGDVLADGQTGLLVPPQPEALAAALLQLIENPWLRLELGAAARAQFRAKYSTDRLVGDHERLYRGLLGLPS